MCHGLTRTKLAPSERTADEQAELGWRGRRRATAQDPPPRARIVLARAQTGTDGRAPSPQPHIAREVDAHVEYEFLDPAIAAVGVTDADADAERPGLDCDCRVRGLEDVPRSTTATPATCPGRPSAPPEVDAPWIPAHNDRCRHADRPSRPHPRQRGCRGSVDTGGMAWTRLAPRCPLPNDVAGTPVSARQCTVV
ncbi:hypothetical protein GCM10009799_00100 [Nocardiopsis rhodophaea]|uniref:Uncharacterized protein n=1 Tax=Nocardiopsis rhodophaea TaxID=280238 RepID=A0ABP5DEM6_9ACTN